MKKWLVALSVLCIFCLVGSAMAGPYTRTIEIEAYETINMSVDVPSVITDPATFEETLCSIVTKADWYCAEYAQVPDYGTFTLDITDTQNGCSHVFVAPDGTTSVVGEYRDKYWFFGWKWTNWKLALLTNNGGSNNWKFSGGNHTEYRNVIATYQDIAGYHNGECILDAYIYSPQVVCPPDAVITHTVTVNYSFDRVVTQIELGDSITVRGHIWTNKPKPVEYWYVAQWATIPAKAKTVAKSDRVLVPDVDGVYATDDFTFTPTKPGIYRIFLRILKADGTRGELRTKVVVTNREYNPCITGVVDCK